MSKFLLVPAAFALALTLAACGGDAPTNETPPAADATTTAPATPEPATPAPATTPPADTMAPAAPASP